MKKAICNCGPGVVLYVYETLAHIPSSCIVMVHVVRGHQYRVYTIDEPCWSAANNQGWPLIQ